MTEQTQSPEFAIEQIYIKDLSWEAPTPLHMLEAEWKPNAEVKMQHTHEQVGDSEHYNVAMTTTVSVSIDTRNVFVAEVVQCGTFTLKNFAPEQLEHVLEVYCPNILLPYARQHLSDVIVRGGFPPLFIGPVDFESQFNAKKADAQTNS